MGSQGQAEVSGDKIDPKLKGCRSEIKKENWAGGGTKLGRHPRGLHRSYKKKRKGQDFYAGSGERSGMAHDSTARTF